MIYSDKTIKNVKQRVDKQKLSLEQTNNIVKRYINGETSTFLAKEYKVCQRTIINILIRNNIKRRSASKSHQIYSINEKYFDDIDNPEKAYIFGLLFSDGNNYPPKNTIVLQLIHTDKYLLEKINNLIESERPLQFVKGKISKIKDQLIKANDSFALKICNKHISEKLLELGLIRAKSLVLQYPTNINEELESHFIRGYFDGNGSFSFSKERNEAQLSIATSVNFAKSLKNIIFNKLNINSYIEYKNGIKNRKYSILRISGNKQVFEFCQWMYKSSSIKLDRKYNKYLEFVETRKYTV
jgi:hypothetical protein